MTKQEKTTRLIAAYQRMSPEGRKVLDKAVRNLAEFPALPVKAWPSEKNPKGGIFHERQL